MHAFGSQAAPSPYQPIAIFFTSSFPHESRGKHDAQGKTKTPIYLRCGRVNPCAAAAEEQQKGSFRRSNNSRDSKMKSEAATLILVNLAAIMERADESLLPGVYKELGAALHTDPTGLGSLTLFRSMVQSSCYPLAAYLAVHHNRAHVIALGAFLWAAATFLVALSSTFLQVFISLH